MEQTKNFKLGAAGVHIIPTATFKTNTFIIQMNAPLIKETASKRALLPNVLQNGTADYANRQQIRSALDELYGASLTTDVTKKGERHIISFRMDIANEKFLKDQTPLMEKGLKLLSSVLLNPKQSNNKFDPKIVAEEKRSHKQKIASIYDDKMRFANKRLTEEMCKEEPFGIHVFGQEDDLDNLNEENLYEYYKQALQEDQLDIYVMGDVDVDHVKNLISTYFPQNQTKDHSGPAPAGSTPALKEKANEVVDEQSVQQGKLHIGYRTQVVYGDDDYFALQLFNGLFGGFSHSKLFINVREKASLAYYAASRVESFKGLLIVMSGIQSANYEKATDIIFKQMEEMKEGKFTEDDLQQTKAVYKNQILETMDVPRGRIELEYHNQVSSNKIPLEEWIDRIDKVTKEDIVKVAGKIQLDTIYFLKGREALSNE
ncbi:insulinase family protein [Salipaludibacillus sp. CUR1]|uniref:EF-P 5-aminopentanol modification-associated protein YfmF n=1 Tax=Salipaludibacillus sp. CUR1 TaxID=2820003 RepID=UPI001E40B79F|nr:pitrilysin family protein [Salipaludibacillus sp. CUR1]MCE7794543.1 insulinase family protein [Salipaludibacillus sp. CUR1]